MKRLLFLLGWLMTVVAVMAQRQVRFIDVETHEPVAKASVEPDGHPFVMTDSLGYATLPETFDSLTVRHLKYATERLGFSEVKDSVYLFANENVLGEVVVVMPVTMMENFNEKLRRSMLPDPAAAPLRINLDRILAFFGYKSKKERKRERVAKILKELGDDAVKEQDEE